jgi:hypothetical protein
MSSVGIIEPLGIRYGLTTNAWIRSASPTATATVTTSSISDFSVDFSFVADDDVRADDDRENRSRNGGRLTGSPPGREAST